MYEITFITLDEEKSKLVKDVLENHKAEIKLEMPLGKKTFAYPIKKEKAGFYMTFYFDVEGKELAAITKTLQAEKDVLRFLLIKSEQNIEEVKTFLANEKKEQKEAEKTVTITDEEEEVLAAEEKQEEVTEKVKTETKEEIKEVKKAKKVAVKKSTKTTKDITKTVKKAKSTKKEPESQDRIKKLEEKLDELLKD